MTIQPENPIVKVHLQFDTLSQALIDTSSIIYLKKAGYFEHIATSINLFSISEIMSEFGENVNEITLIDNTLKSQTTDQKLISIATQINRPVISEDKRLLSTLQNKNLTFFNSLVILNYLLYIKKINNTQYLFYHERLKKIARYSPKIWKFGKQIFLSISRQQLMRSTVWKKATG